MIKRIVTTLALAALLGSAGAALLVAPQLATAAPTIDTPARIVAQADPTQDPLTAAKFSLVVDGVEIAAFNEIVSLESEIDPGATAGATRGPTAKPASTNPLPNVTLKRGMTKGMELWAWHQAAVAGPLDSVRKTASLIMYDTAGAPVARFWLTRAWPASIGVTALKAGSSEILYETVTFVCDKIERVSPS